MRRAWLSITLAGALIWAPSIWAGQVDLLDFGKIEAGMTEAEVLVRLGPPDKENFEGYTPGNALMKSYYYFSEPDRYQKITTVITFIGGRVARKERFYSQQ